jgi:hypothetical protein
MNKFSMILIAFLVTSAYAADIQLNDGPNGPPPSATLSGLSIEMSQDIAALPVLNATMANAATANANARKEANVYVADQKEKLAAVEKAIAWQLENVLGPQKRPYEAAVASYNGRCGNHSLPQQEYNACLSEKSHLDGLKSSIEAWWEDYKSKWNKQNVDPVNAVIKQQNDRLTALNVVIEHTSQDYNAAMQRSQSLRVRIAEIEAIFRKVCTNVPGADKQFTKQEALKYCNSISWDGASDRLVPMYDYRGTGGTSTN